MQKPLIVITLSYISGLFLGHGFLYFPYTFIVLLALLFTGAVLLLRSGRLDTRRFGFAAVSCLLGITLYVIATLYFPPDHYTRHITPDRTIHDVTGRIVSPLDRDPGRVAFIMRTREADGVPVSGRMRVSVRDAQVETGYGDIVRLQGRLFEPGVFKNPGGFDYRAYLAKRSIYLTVSVTSAAQIGIIRRGNGIFRTIQDWRERIRRSFLASTTGPGSAILQAMVLGEEGALNDDIRDRFMAAGVTHILSISGSHLGLVALLFFGFMRGLLYLLPERFYNRLTLAMDLKKAAAWCIMVPVTFYALLAGGQTATLRSLVMILFALAALILDRENGLMHSLAAAALLILIVNPQAIFEISFQLSYFSVLSIGYVVTLWNDLQLKAETLWRKFRNAVVLLVLISIATSLVTGPLVARYFNHLSLAGIVSNMVIVPFAGFIVVPIGLVSGVLSLLTDTLPLAHLNQLAADSFYSIVTLFSRIPFAEFHPPSPGVLWMVLYSALLLALAAYVRSRLLYTVKPLEYSGGIPKTHTIRIAAAGSGLLLIVLISLLPRTSGRVTFLDVGQGDCALVELPAGKNILIDGGGAYGNRFDMGRRVVSPYLWDRGIGTIDLVILSHPHPDHMNGITSLLKTFPVAELWKNGQETAWTDYKNFVRTLTDRKIPSREVSAGNTMLMGEARVTVLHPVSGFTPRSGKDYINENNHSLVTQLTFHDTTLLFTGDIHAEAEKALIERGQDIACDVLKVPHHGSRSSSTEEFLSLARPAIAVVTVGRKNRYGHPSDEVTARYDSQGTRLYRTDRDGAVIVTLRNNGVEVVPWARLIYQRITLDGGASWRSVEGENWKRLWIRTTSGNR